MYSIIHFIMVFLGTITGFTIANFSDITFFGELFPENPLLFTSLLFGSSGYLLGVLTAFIINLVIRKIVEKIRIHNSIPVFYGMAAGLVLANLLLIPVYVFFINLDVESMFVRYLKLIIPVFLNICLAYAGAKIGEKYFLEDNEMESSIIADTNIFIDGRISKIINTGIFSGKILVPVFIISELQTLADSSDDMKRKKGREGLQLIELLSAKGKVKTIEFKEYEDADTDDRLIKVCRKFNGILFSNDYNLIKKANISGIRTIFMKELEDSLKPNALVGDRFNIDLVKAGKEKNQAVGYLNDGTMIVAQNGSDFIGKNVMIEIKNIVNTNAGKIIFGDVIDL